MWRNAQKDAPVPVAGNHTKGALFQGPTPLNVIKPNLPSVRPSLRSVCCLSLLLHVHVTDSALRPSAFWLSNSQVTVIPSLIIAPSKVSRKSHLLESRLFADFRKGEAWDVLAPLCNQKTSALCKALQTMSVSPQRQAAAGTLSRQWRNINCVAPQSCLLKIHPHQVAGGPQPQQHSFS